MEVRFAEYVAYADQQKPMHASTGCGRGGDPCFLDTIYCARKTSSVGVVQLDVRDFIGTEQILNC
jgi:hypothetical protein